MTKIFLQELIEKEQLTITIQEEKEQLLKEVELLSDMFCEIRKRMENYEIGTSNDDLIVLGVIIQ